MELVCLKVCSPREDIKCKYFEMVEIGSCSLFDSVMVMQFDWFVRIFPHFAMRSVAKYNSSSSSNTVKK
jgi:hypothetical protein